jgi:hypothetical protein
MKTAEVQTRCECQGRLSAVISEAGTVLSGSARQGKEAAELAPATAMGAGGDQFRVGWLCPLCGRNTLRSFYRGALVFRESSDDRVAS